ncbi:hypothetical protein B0E46_16995 [Rhodanobacter sp. B04]|nr:hypothetical protein B0E46_16995 [Rhodanobacter sp. B04]
MDRGKTKELRDLLFGLSPYNDKTAREPAAELPSIALTKLVNTARNHLDFVCKFGEQADHVIKGRKHHFAHKEQFAHWLAEDAPGVSESELDRLLKAHA